MGSLSPQSRDPAAWETPSEESPSLFTLFVASYGLRLFVWSALLGAAILGVVVLSESAHSQENSAAYILLEGYAVLIGVCVVYCLWVQYSVTGERKLLLFTMAFSGLSLAALVQGIAVIACPETASCARLFRFYYPHGWQIAAGCLLAVAAGNKAVDNSQSFRRAGVRMIGGPLVLSFCIVGAVLVFGPDWLRIRAALPAAIQPAWSHFWAWLSAREVVIALAAISFGAALFAHARAFADQEDEFSRRVTWFLVLAMSANGALLASRTAYDLTWWSAHVLLIGGLLLLLIELGAEFGSSYSDARARIKHLEAVHYVSSRLMNTLDLRVVLLALVSDTASMLSARYASVMLADDAGQTLTTEVTHGLPESPLRPREPQPVEGKGRPGFYSGHTAKAFREKRVCVVDDVYTDVEFIPWRQLAQHDGCAVSVPLVYQDIALGVLDLFFEKHVPLNDERIKLFQTLAAAAGVAIANAQLYDKTLQAEAGDADAERALGALRLRLAS